ncbi:cwf21-domain-containing protein, partial [Testicularia cyperi]
MYNGIGLKTVRGTGTNGYIQRNLSNFRPRDNPFDKSSSRRGGAPSFDDDVGGKVVQPDAAILEHERKRKVEVKCMELQVQLEDDEVDQAEIESRVDELRKRLTEELGVGADRRQFRDGDTHRIREAKNREGERLGRALGVASDYKEGDAFNRELQERKKQERIEERKRADE